MAVGGAAAALVAVAVVAIVLLTGGGDDAPVGNPEQAATGVSADTAYQEQVAKAFGPVLGANQQVSARLEALKGTKPDSARRAVQQAKEATTAARGALSALSVPDTQSALATNAVQVIDRQEAYLTAVESVLGHPTVAGAAQLQTLSSNLISAFHTAGPAVAGETQTVSGADRLETWARTTRATLNKRAKAKREKAKRAREQSGSGSGSSTPAAPRGESCGDGVYAGPNTSCSFAFNVRDAYNGAPGAAATVRVYSPVTNQTYTMNCRPSGTGITCSGGNNASVTF